MLWDRGTWEAEGDARKGHAKGDLKFTLHGERLKGRWVLVRMRSGKEDKNRLLIKKKDAESVSNDSEEVTEKFDTSVASGRTMDEIGSKSREIRQGKDLRAQAGDSPATEEAVVESTL